MHSPLQKNLQLCLNLYNFSMHNFTELSLYSMPSNFSVTLLCLCLQDVVFQDISTFNPKSLVTCFTLTLVFCSNVLRQKIKITCTGFQPCKTIKHESSWPVNTFYWLLLYACISQSPLPYLPGSKVPYGANSRRATC